MAQTSEGKRLTDAHRIAQVKVRNQVEREAKKAMKLLDLDNISGSWAWKLDLLQIMRDGYTDSVKLATTYMETFPEVDAGITEQIIVSPFSARDADVIINAEGVAAIKKGIKAGELPEQAAARVASSLAAAAAQQAIAGGRNLIDSTVRYSGRSGQYRRVGGSSLCAFCAMLVGRGPVYSQTTGYFRSHDHCGCTAEPVYGEWVPTDQEALWRDAYRQAAEAADDYNGIRVAPSPMNDEDTILWRMRRQHPELFTDGVVDDAPLGASRPARRRTF